MTDTDIGSYIDTDTILSSDFSAISFANTLVTTTNNASDTVVDLSTPLSRVLFDVQEIDTHLHTLSTGSAEPLLAHAGLQTASAANVLSELEGHVARLTERYKQLDEDVVQRHAVAEEVRLAASRLWVTVKIGRAVQRALLLGRQLDTNMEEAMRLGALKGPTTASDSKSAASLGSEEAAAVIRAAHSVLALKALLQASGPGEEGEHLSRINIVATLRTDLFAPAEQRLRARAQQIIREFSLSSVPAGATSNPSDVNAQRTSSPSPAQSPATISYAQSSSARARTAAAAQALYLLSPVPNSKRLSEFQPQLMIASCDAYIRAALSASSASLARALAALSTLPRVLTEVSARCQNVSALEKLLASTTPPEHALLLTSHDSLENHGGTKNSTSSAQELLQNSHNGTQDRPKTLLTPLLDALDTTSLPSYFWRSLAGDVSHRVTDLMGRGGVGARQLRASRDRLRDSLREAVLRGCEGALAHDRTATAGTSVWEREVGVMVSSVLGPIGR